MSDNDPQGRDPLDDPRWEALVRGTISKEDEDALRAVPIQPGGEASPYELLRPLSDEERSALHDKLFARLTTEQAPVVPLRPPQLRPARSRFLYLLAAALGVICTVAVVMWRRAPSPSLMSRYAIAIDGGDKALLGTGDAPETRLRPGSRVAFTLRPDAPIEGGIAARFFLVQGSEVRVWKPPFVVLEGGVIRVEGSREALFEGVPDGTWTAVFFVSAPADVPSDRALMEAARDRSKAIPMKRVVVILEHSKGAARPTDEVTPIELAGCAAVSRGPVCEIDPGASIRLWIGDPSGDVEVAIDGARATPAFVPARGGRRAEIAIPAGSKEIVARVGWRSLRVAVASRETSDEIRSAEKLRAEGKLDDAAASLARVPLSVSPAIALAKKRLAARLAFDRRDAAKGLAMLRETAIEALALGRVSDEHDDRFARAAKLIDVSRSFAEARAELDALASARGPDRAYSKGVIEAAYYRARIEVETGDLRAALRSLDEVEEGMERLGLGDYTIAVRSERAGILSAFGRYEEAISERRKIVESLPQGAPPCRRARAANNLGWTLIRASAAGASAADPIAVLEEAVPVARSGCPLGLGYLLTNLAIALYDRDRTADAEVALQQARDGSRSSSVEDAVWWRLVDAGIALKKRSFRDALTRYEELSAMSRALMLPEATFLSALGEAEALAAMDRADDAARAYEKADRYLDAWSRAIPFGEGKDTFLAQYQRATSLRVGFLVREAKRAAGSRREALLREASIAARSGPARLARAFAWVDRVGSLPADRRARWEAAIAEYRAARAALEASVAGDWRRAPSVAAGRSEERARLRSALDRALAEIGEGPSNALIEPPEPAPGELILAATSTKEGWVAFAITRDRIVHRALDRADRASIEAAVITSFAAEIRAVTRVRLPAHGALALVAPQAIAEPRAIVTYGAELPRHEAAAGATKALVITDPTEDAPHTRESAGAIATSLAHKGWAVTRVEGERATFEAVREALEQPGVGLVHYGGHAETRGLDDIDAALLLAGDRRFTSADVLALARVPEVVVLAACEGGGKANKPGVMGLAQAFLIKGARVVIASFERVPDEAAARFAASFSARAAPSFDPAEQLRAVQTGGDAAWATFRALVR